MRDIFDIIIPESLVTVVAGGVVLGAFVMATIQRAKELPFINKEWHIWILNLIFSFGLGFLMMRHFFMYNVVDALWAGFFAFLGAPALYETLKNYTPKRLADTVKVPEKEKVDIDLTKGDE